MLSPVSDRAEQAAEISCSRWKKPCSAIQPVRHLPDCRYRLLLHFAAFRHPAIFLAFEDYCLELDRNDGNSQMSSPGGRPPPYLEMHRFWRLQRSPNNHKGRVSPRMLHALTEVHYARQNVVLFPTVSAQTLLAEFQMLSCLPAQANRTGNYTNLITTGKAKGNLSPHSRRCTLPMHTSVQLM